MVSGTTDDTSHTLPNPFPFVGTSQALNPNTTYYWQVQAWNTNGTDGHFSQVFSFTTGGGPVPASPTSLVAVGTSNNILLQWQDNATNETGFVIERKTGAGGTWSVINPSVPPHPGTGTVVYQDSGLAFGNSYYYRVYAFNCAGSSQLYTNESAATTLATPVLTAPANGATLTSSSVTLQWNSVAGAQFYGIDMGSSCGATNVLNDQASGSNSYTLNLPNGTYHWRVKAAAGSPAPGLSDVSSCRSFTVNAQPPPPPTDLIAAGSSNNVLLQWQDNATNETGFVIERKTGVGGTWSVINPSVPPHPGTGTVVYQDSGLAFGNTYYYRVYAFNSGGNSNPSNESAATTLATPVLTSPENGQTLPVNNPVLIWNVVAGAEGYGIDLGSSCGSTNVLDNHTVTSNFHQVTLPNGTYHWRVRAMNGTAPGVSNVSACRSFSINVEPVPPPPVILSPGEPAGPGPAESTTTPVMTWEASAGATHYGLYISEFPYGSNFIVYQNENVPAGTSFEIPPGELFSGNLYRWNMVAKNSANQESSVSNTLYFQVDVTGPQAGEIHVSPLELDFECVSGIMGPPPPGGGSGSPPDGGIAGGDVAGRPAGEFLPRTKPIKPDQTIVDPLRHEEHVIRVKFHDDLSIRLRDGHLTDFDTGVLQDAHQTIEKFADGGVWQRRTEIPEERLDEMRDVAQRNLGRVVADSNSYFFLFLPPDVDAAAAIDAFNALEIVELARPVDRPLPPPLPPDFQPNQGYLNPAPNGVDAYFSWNQLGTQGENVRIVDIEYTFNANHQDLPNIQIIGPPPQDPAGYGPHHGTAVLGQLGSIGNGWGTTGIAPDSDLFFAGAFTSGKWDIAGAIVHARNALSAGDIILIEQQIAGPHWPINICCWNPEDCPPGTNCQYGLVPTEWDKEVYDEIEIAVALGITVVQAAGNGFQNLDDPVYAQGNFGHWPFLPQNDSWAIIVGAGHAPTAFGGYSVARSRMSFSNYGSRVNMQGWGERVWTTGYGCNMMPCQSDCYGQAGQNDDELFTGCFGGTSSASPIVAGAAALLQSAYKAKYGTTLHPSLLRTILRESGSSQQDSPAFPADEYPIGPLPNVAAAWSDLVHSFTITNNGNGPLIIESITLDSPAPWINWNAPSTPFVIEPNGTQTVIVSVDCDKAPQGESTRRFLITSDDPDPSQSPYPGGVFIHVNNPSGAVPPILAGIPDATVHAPNPYAGPTPTLIQGTPPISWSLVTGPLDMTINPSTGVVFWPVSDIFGSPYPITIRASNDADFDEATWLLTVLKPGDLDGNGVVNVFDLLLLLGAWGECVDCNDCSADLDGNCTVNVFDLLILLGNWGVST